MVSSRARRQLGQHLRHADARLVGEDRGVQRHVLGLEVVVQLLAQPRRHLLEDLARVDRRVHARMQGEHHLELVEVGLHGRVHVGILQLAGQRPPVVRHRAVHLAERGRGGRLRLEALEAAGPVGTQLGDHAPAHEGRPHRRGLRLQLGELLGVFGRQSLGDGGHQLRHLHDRPLQAAERRRQRRRVLGVVAVDAEQPLAGDARGHRADVGADLDVAGRPRAEAVFFLVVLVGHGPSWLPHVYRVMGTVRPVDMMRRGGLAH